MEGSILGSNGTTKACLNDNFGNAVASVSGTSVTWNNARVAGYGALPGNTVQSLSATVGLDQATVWRGKRIDETGFYYLGARYYESQSGRFLSADPRGHSSSPSLYDYANADPINSCDPDGRIASAVAQRLIDPIVGNDYGAAWKNLINDLANNNWAPGPTGGLGEQGLVPKSIADGLWRIDSQLPLDASLNGFHAWHAGSNAYLTQQFGLLGVPLIFLGGVCHETPFDSKSFWDEQRNQGTVNHTIDSTMDIVSNGFGIFIGYNIRGQNGVSSAIYLGNHIPGPSDPDPAHGGTGHTYNGNPSDAWGPHGP